MLFRIHVTQQWAMLDSRVIYRTIPMLVHILIKANESIISSIEPEMVSGDLLLLLFLPFRTSLSILDNVKCLEAYPKLHKVINNPRGLYYSDHLAVYARFEIDDSAPEKRVKPLEDVEIADEQTREALRSACILVEESVQRIQRDRIFWAIMLFILLCLLFSLNGNLLSNGYLFVLFTIVKNVLCLVGISVCLWFICLGKPVERNALSSIQNAMRIRLRAAQFSY
jgi:hypothetical protein